MNWSRKCSYEVPRLVTLAIFILFIGVYLAERRHDQIVASFIGGGIAAVFGFFQLGRARRPRLRAMWSIVLRYVLLPALLILVLLLRHRLPAALPAGCFAAAAMLLAREACERAPGD
jgi:uncharacterized membrane protein